MPRPTAANSIWPHLKTGDQAPKQQQQRAQSNLAGAMYPKQSAEQRAWEARRERDRHQLLQGLRELNARIDARLQGKR